MRNKELLLIGLLLDDASIGHRRRNGIYSLGAKGGVFRFWDDIRFED